jgi:hypothetical protein
LVSYAVSIFCPQLRRPSHSTKRGAQRSIEGLHGLDTAALAARQMEQVSRLELWVGSGFYESASVGKLPQNQLLTIQELLEGKQVDRPPSRADATSQRAQRTVKASGQLRIDE